MPLLDWMASVSRYWSWGRTIERLPGWENGGRQQKENGGKRRTRCISGISVEGPQETGGHLLTKQPAGGDRHLPKLPAPEVIIRKNVKKWNQSTFFDLFLWVAELGVPTQDSDCLHKHQGFTGNSPVQFHFTDISLTVDTLHTVSEPYSVTVIIQTKYFSLLTLKAFDRQSTFMKQYICHHTHTHWPWWLLEKDINNTSGNFSSADYF